MVLRGDLGGPLGIEEATEPEVFETLRSKGTIRFKIRHNQLERMIIQFEIIPSHSGVRSGAFSPLNPPEAEKGLIPSRLRRYNAFVDTLLLCGGVIHSVRLEQWQYLK